MEPSGQAVLPALHPSETCIGAVRGAWLSGEQKEPRDTANSANCFRRAKAWAPNVPPSSIAKGTNTWSPHTCWTPRMGKNKKTSYCRCRTSALLSHLGSIARNAAGLSQSNVAIDCAGDHVSDQMLPQSIEVQHHNVTRVCPVARPETLILLQHDGALGNTSHQQDDITIRATRPACM